LIPLNNPLDNQNVQNPRCSESLISNSTISKTETESFDKDFSEQSSIDNKRQRIELTNLLSLDLVQSSAHFIYPNLKLISPSSTISKRNSRIIFSYFKQYLFYYFLIQSFINLLVIYVINYV
jgi:hypothetical protein